MTIKIKPHFITDGKDVVEIYGNDNRLIAAIYITDDEHLKLVSKHLTSVAVDKNYPATAIIFLDGP